MDHNLPHGWEEHLDESTGAIFYYHPATQVTQWERPAPIHMKRSGSLSHKEVISQALDQILVNDRVPYGKQKQYGLEPINGGHYAPGGGAYPQQQQPQQAHYYYPDEQNQLPYHHYNQPQQQPVQQPVHQHQLQPQSHQTLQPMNNSSTKRTTVKIKTKKQLSVLKNANNNKVHVQEDDPLGPEAESKEGKNSSDPPVGGKSQDYLGMVKIYNLQRPFLDRQHNINCVLCQRVVPEDIFFPCEHKVVCRECIQREQVCADYDMVKFPNGHCNCPLCAAIIKLILPNENGKEVEKYWKWVLAVKPELPQGFLKNFRHSAAIIQKVHIDENIRLRKRENMKKACCLIS